MSRTAGPWQMKERAVKGFKESDPVGKHGWKIWGRSEDGDGFKAVLDCEYLTKEDAEAIVLVPQLLRAVQFVVDQVEKSGPVLWAAIGQHELKALKELVVKAGGLKI